MKFTKIPETTFQNIQLNAGILLDGFNPATGVIGNILGATTGGFQFSDDPEYLKYALELNAMSFLPNRLSGVVWMRSV